MFSDGAVIGALFTAYPLSFEADQVAAGTGVRTLIAERLSARKESYKTNEARFQAALSLLFARYAALSGFAVPEVDEPEASRAVNGVRLSVMTEAASSKVVVDTEPNAESGLSPEMRAYVEGGADYEPPFQLTCSADAAASTTRPNDDAATSQNERGQASWTWRFAADPSEFWKSETESGGSIAVTLDEQKGEDRIDGSFALGVGRTRTFNSRFLPQCESSDDVQATDDHCVFPHTYTYMPYLFINQDRKATDGEAKPEYEENEVAAGLSLLFDINLPQRGGPGGLPHRRVELGGATEYITDDAFESVIWRSELFARPIELLPVGRDGFGLGQWNERCAPVLLAQEEGRACRFNTPGSIWVKWDTTFTYDWVHIGQYPEPCGEGVDNAHPLCDLHAFNRFGANVSFAVSLRRPHAIAQDEGWITWSNAYQVRRNIWEDGGDGDAERFESKVTMPLAGFPNFALSLGYTRGENLRSLVQQEKWALNFEYKH